jgi:peroxiredoxin
MVFEEQMIMVDEKQTPEAPDFTAPDSDFRAVQLSSYEGKKNVVLVFNRGFF